MDDRTRQTDPLDTDDQHTGDPGDAGDAIEADAPEDRLAPEPGPAPARRMRFRPAREEPLASRPQASPTAATTTAPRSRAWLWPLVSLLGLAAVILVNWLANWLPLNDRTTGQVSDAHPVPFQPAGWVFGIWIVIYALLAIFVILSFLPAGRRPTRINAVGPVFLIANIANVAWIFLWHWLRFQGALIALVVLLAAVATIYLMLRASRHDHQMSTLRRLAVALPFSVYTAWATIATIANIEVWMREGGWDGGIFGLRGWTVIFLLAGIIIAAGVAFFGHDAAFPLVFVWAYLGIAQRQWDNDMLLSILAIVLVVAAAALTVMAFILSFDARSGPRMTSTPRGPIWRRGTGEGQPSA